MARTAQTLEEERVWYIVDIEDNREDADPMRALISPMSAADLERHKQAPLVDLRHAKPDADHYASYERRTARLRDECLREHVHDFYGYELRLKAGRTLKPTDGKTLVSAIKSPGVPPSELAILDDIYSAITDRSVLSEGAQKKSNLPCDSSPQETSAA